MLKKVLKDPGVLVCLIIIVALVVLGFIAPLVAPHDPLEVQATLKYAPPSPGYPVGNDYLGRDVFSRLLYGIRPSLLWVLLAMITINVIALGLAMLAGYRRRGTDEVIMRICDIMLSFPSEIMVLAIVGIIGVGLRNILIVIVLLGWPWYTRVYRSAVMKYSDKNYVIYSRSIGNSMGNIMLKELLPAVLPEVAVIAAGNIASLIMSISSYSFLGLGIQAPAPEWGAMLNQAKESLALNPQQMIAPAAVIVGVCILFSLFADNLRNALDVKHVKSGWRRKLARYKKQKRKEAEVK